MPVYRVYFEKSLDITVEGSSKDAVQAAAHRACAHEIDHEWGDDTNWEVVAVGEAFGERSDQGLKDGKIVHISDAEPAPSEIMEGP